MKAPNLPRRLFEWQYRKQAETNYFISPAAEFSAVIARTRHWVMQAGEALDTWAELEMLTFLMDAVKEDLSCSAACEWIYALPDNTRDWRRALDFGLRLRVKYEGPTEVSSEGKTVVASPHDPTKTFLAIRSILLHGFHTRFNQFSGLNEYDGIYYPELELISVVNGRHHSWVAAQMRQYDVYQVCVYRLEDMFPTIYTDGEHWYNRDRPEIKQPVWDVRVAILYEMAKMKTELEQKIES